MRTAFTMPGSSVKTLRDQSALAPSLRCWSAMRLRYLRTHIQVRSTNASRPRSWRVRPSLREFAFDHVLGGDAGVVFAREPERGVALHAMPADERVGDRIFEAVAEVQFTGHVRRRHDDAVGLAVDVDRGWK